MNSRNFEILLEIEILDFFKKKTSMCRGHGCHADVFGRTDGRTDDRTMAAAASVTWTHCSVLSEVTWGKQGASACMGPRGRISLPSPPLPPLPPSFPPSLPPSIPPSLPPLCCPRGREK
jgi:hypothetical protein